MRIYYLYILILFFSPYNSLFGQNKMYILKDLEGMSYLDYDNVKVLVIEYYDKDTLPEIVMKCEKLESITISASSAMQFECVMRQLSQFPMLRKLKLTQNNLSDVPDGLRNLKNLESIDFSQNRISYIPCFINNLPKLTSIEFDINQLTSKSIVDFFNCFNDRENVLLSFSFILNTINAIPENVCKYSKLLLYLNENPINYVPECIYDFNFIEIHVSRTISKFPPRTVWHNLNIEEINDKFKTKNRRSRIY